MIPEHYHSQWAENARFHAGNERIHILHQILIVLGTSMNKVRNIPFLNHPPSVLLENVLIYGIRQ